METRASHLVIGSFVLVVVASVFGFVIWLAKVEIDREFDYYTVVFDQGVTGLSTAADVLYNGIPVGTVTAINIDPDNPSLVRVVIEVASDTPVRTDTSAALEFKGITGVSYIQLTGGSANKPMLAAKRVGEAPEIKAKASAIQKLFAGAPQVLDQANLVLMEVRNLIRPDNVENFSNVLANMEEITARIRDNAPAVERIIKAMDESTDEAQELIRKLDKLTANLDAVAASADATLAVARGTLSNVDELVDGDGRQVIADIITTARRVEETSKVLQDLIEANREPVTGFSQDGLVEFTKFIEEARLLVASTARLIEDLEADPAQFLFGERGGQFQAEE